MASQTLSQSSRSKSGRPKWTLSGSHAGAAAAAVGTAADAAAGAATAVAVLAAVLVAVEGAVAVRSRVDADFCCMVDLAVGVVVGRGLRQMSCTKPKEPSSWRARVTADA
eukprot:4777858-Pleurochrysis_carterae.AAC.1